MKKTIFITGASSGIGKATAKYFQHRGWNVIATMRSPQKEEDLTKLDNILVTRLDVQDPGSITAAVKAGIAKFGKIAQQSTEREIAAAEAERASVKYKQVEYMQTHIGEVFDGTISGVTEWGIYIEEVNTRCEGMVFVRNLTDDFYQFDKKHYSLVGEKTKKKYRLGDPIKFKVMGADLERKTLDYMVA